MVNTSEVDFEEGTVVDGKYMIAGEVGDIALVFPDVDSATGPAVEEASDTVLRLVDELDVVLILDVPEVTFVSFNVTGWYVDDLLISDVVVIVLERAVEVTVRTVEDTVLEEAGRVKDEVVVEVSLVEGLVAVKVVVVNGALMVVAEAIVDANPVVSRFSIVVLYSIVSSNSAAGGEGPKLAGLTVLSLRKSDVK